LELIGKSWKEGGGWSLPRMHAVIPSSVEGELEDWITLLPVLSALVKVTGLPITQLRTARKYIHIPSDFDKLSEIATLEK
jgi:hypothetical protein